MAMLEANENDSLVESIFCLADYEELSGHAYEKRYLLVISFEPEEGILSNLCLESNRYLAHQQLARLANTYKKKGIIFASCHPLIDEDTARACSVNVSYKQVIHFYREGNVMVDRVIADTAPPNEVYGMVDEICQRYAKRSCCVIL